MNGISRVSMFFSHIQPCSRQFAAGFPPKNPSCAIWFCGYVGSMKWQPLLSLGLVVVAAALLIWRSSGKKSGNCGCKCGCAHEPEAAPKKEEALR
jgi:hypothetical protein